MQGAGKDESGGAGQALLAIVWHSRTGAAEAMARAAWDGARADNGAPRAVLLRADEATPAALLAARGFLFACPENLGAMSGAMKEMFDCAYYPLLGQVEGRGYAAMIAAGSAGQGALAQMERIVTGWRLRRIAPPIIANMQADRAETILAAKTLPDDMARRCRELGALMAEGLEIGAF